MSKISKNGKMVCWWHKFILFGEKIGTVSDCSGNGIDGLKKIQGLMIIDFHWIWVKQSS